ncbi:hypothetical protein D3093_15540 (plasmid) [Azospirillum argentinense]|uniref:Uncharacterized protein n=1 Tax=Azospirillum argentinense TaxID=2970906 RepID=A0A4D8PM00_9PROT|nr:hypothetical protein D3093_15540 [Azospirillum argentinense]
MAPKAPGEGAAEDQGTDSRATLTLPARCAGPFPLPGREREHRDGNPPVMAQRLRELPVTVARQGAP